MEDYEEYLKSKKDKGKVSFKIFEKIKPVHVILLAILFYVGTLISNSGNSNWVYVVLAVIAVIYLFSVVKQGTERNPIPRHIAQEIARQDLLIEIEAGRAYSHGTKIVPTSFFYAESEGAEGGLSLFKYHFGFIVTETNSAPKEIVYRMNPFTGNCMGIEEKPLGFWGQEIKDIKLVFPEKVFKEEKKD